MVIGDLESEIAVKGRAGVLFGIVICSLRGLFSPLKSLYLSNNVSPDQMRGLLVLIDRYNGSTWRQPSTPCWAAELSTEYRPAPSDIVWTLKDCFIIGIHRIHGNEWKSVPRFLRLSEVVLTL